MKKIFQLIVVLMTLYSLPGYSKYCEADTGIDDSLTFGSVWVNNETPVGSIVSMIDDPGIIKCATSNLYVYQLVGVKQNPAWSSDGEEFIGGPTGESCQILDKGFSLEDSGLGIVWFNYNSATDKWVCMSSAFTAGAAIKRGLKANGSVTITDRFYLVRTNKPLRYGSSNDISQKIEIDEGSNLNGTDPVTNNGLLYIISLSGSVDIEKAACTVESPAEVNMGTISTQTFKGIGTTTHDVPFSFHLTNCNAQRSTALVQIIPVQGFADTENAVINIERGDNAASGVGIQLLTKGEY